MLQLQRHLVLVASPLTSPSLAPGRLKWHCPSHLESPMSADPLLDRLARALAGRYTVARELGRGGMATVYLATDVKLGRRVAIKVLPPTTRAYLGSGRFQREVLFAAPLPVGLRLRGRESRWVPPSI